MAGRAAPPRMAAVAPPPGNASPTSPQCFQLSFTAGDDTGASLRCVFSRVVSRNERARARASVYSHSGRAAAPEEERRSEVEVVNMSCGSGARRNAPPGGGVRSSCAIRPTGSSYGLEGGGTDQKAAAVGRATIRADLSVDSHRVVTRDEIIAASSFFLFSPSIRRARGHHLSEGFAAPLAVRAAPVARDLRGGDGWRRQPL